MEQYRREGFVCGMVGHTSTDPKFHPNASKPCNAPFTGQNSKIGTTQSGSATGMAAQYGDEEDSSQYEGLQLNATGFIRRTQSLDRASRSNWWRPGARKPKLYLDDDGNIADEE